MFIVSFLEYCMFNSKLSRTLALLCLMGFLYACSSDTSTNPPTEFIASDSDFSNWMSWTMVAEKSGPDPALGEAHSGNDNTVKRKIYIKQSNAQKGSNGQYPNGTIVVKQTLAQNGTEIMVVGMAKRGGSSFNKDHNGWEWFVLNSNGSIKDRGDKLMNNMCNTCHSSVKSSKDYVFSK